MHKLIHTGIFFAGFVLGAATLSAAPAKEGAVSEPPAAKAPARPQNPPGGGIQNTAPSTAAKGGAAATAPKNENLKEFDFEVLRGKHVFVGFDAGSKERWDIDKGVVPAHLFLVSPKSAEKKMLLRVSIDLKDGRPASFPWNFKTTIFTRKEHDGGSLSFYDKYDPQQTLAGNGRKRLVELVPVKVAKVENSEVKAAVYHIPYLKVEGEVRHLVVVIADSAEDVKAAVQIPKAFVFFKWENAFDEYK